MRLQFGIQGMLREHESVRDHPVLAFVMDFCFTLGIFTLICDLSDASALASVWGTHSSAYPYLMASFFAGMGWLSTRPWARGATR